MDDNWSYMKTTYIEFLGDVPLYFGFGIKVVIAILLGGLIGWDREKKMKAAGLKTNMLICLGACVYTSVSQLSLLLTHNPVADPNRVAAQIVSGIGFLGAGAILQSRGNIIGLTTAAGIWTVGAIGMTVGLGFPLVSTIITLTILVVFRFIDPLNKLLESSKQYCDYHIEILSTGRVRGLVKDILFTKIDDIDEVVEEILNKETDQRILHVYVKLHPRWIDNLRGELKKMIRVDKVNIYKR